MLLLGQRAASCSFVRSSREIKQLSLKHEMPRMKGKSMMRIPKMSSSKRVQPSASSASEIPAASPPSFDINEGVEFLRSDLQHLFDDRGVDASAYDEEVEFQDPITWYSSLQGYLFNIQLLKQVFKPEFQLHDIQATGPYTVLARWTMIMDFTPAKLLPIRLWTPKLIFTGTSTYGFNPATRRINRHIDTWDSISNQEFFSMEAAADVVRQLLDASTVPEGLETPDFKIIRRTQDYQVREYQPFVVAETFMDGGEDSTSRRMNPAAPAGGRAFNTLARYIFGGNARREKMAMTTPVFSDTDGAMQFVMEPSKHKDVSSLPQPPPNTPLKVQAEAASTVAARAFPGLAFPSETEREAQALFAALRRDGVPFDESAGYRLARYNDPGTLPPFRRNEILVRLEPSYNPVWAAGELETQSRAARK